MNIKSVQISRYYNDKKAVYCSTWDDMTKTSLYEISDIANSFGIKTTLYINCTNKEWKTPLFYPLESDKESWDLTPEITQRLINLHRRGNEIGNHTYSHKNLNQNNINSNILYDELYVMNDFITNITNQKEYTFCYPWGNIPRSKDTMDTIDRSFLSCRTVGYPKNKSEIENHINIFSLLKNNNTRPLDLNRLKALHIGSYPNTKTLDELNYSINLAIEKRGWIIEYGHGIDEDGWCPISEDLLKKHYEYVSSLQNELWLTTVLEATKYYIQREVIVIKQETQDGEIILSFNIDSDNPLYSKFVMIKEYVPLTIKIELDSKYISMNFIVYQNNIELPFRIDNKYPLESYVTHVSHMNLQGAPTESSENSSIGRIPLRFRKDIFIETNQFSNNLRINYN